MENRNFNLRLPLLADFRVLQVEAASEACGSPVELMFPGHDVRGAKNTVPLRVASLTDFLVMKLHAIGGRDKPKDTYDLCYCLEQFPGGMENSRRIGSDAARRRTSREG